MAGATTAAATILLQIPRTVPDNLASAEPIVILEPAHSTLIAPAVTGLKTLVIPDGAVPALARRPDAPTFVYFPQEPIQIDTRPAPPHAPLRDDQITVLQGNGTKYDKRIETLVAAGASVERRAMGLLPSRSVVRYFYRGDMKKAETVASLLSLDAQHLDNYSPKPEPAVIEVILGN